MNKPFGVIFWCHLLFNFLAALSPLWLDWKLIVLGFIILHMQWWFFDGCLLTFLETGRDKYMTFEYYYLSKVWPNIDKKKLKFVVTYITPSLLLIITYILQIKLGWKPLIQI